MQLQQPSLLVLAEAVADGTNIDWERAESSAETAGERHVIQQLRSLAAVGLAARGLASSWGPLEIRGEVGSGAFGTVYRAWDRRLEREVALKLLHVDRLDQPIASTVVKEGRFLAQIRHPNVVTVYGADEYEGRVGIWMEFVSGRTMKEIVTEQGPFGAHEAAIIGRDLCGALAAVHQRGFVHRDIKAQNVMREAGGRTVLMDFGAGEAVIPGEAPSTTLRGTPVYLAPELLEGVAPSVQTDLYSLGVLLYFLVSGEFPVVGASLVDFRERHATHKRRLLRDVRPDLPPAFVRVVDALTAPNPTERPESAGAVDALLERALGLRKDEAPATGEGVLRDRPSERPALRGRRVAAIGAVLLILAGAGWVFRDAIVRKAPASVTRSSVAILPFKNLTPTGDNDYFSDGITQDVVAHLASVRDLQVIAGASARRYKGSAKSVTEIGAELGVAAVVEGSVQRSGDRVRIVSRLLDAVTGQLLWSDSFERDVKEVFALQSEVSRKIALALKGSLSKLDAERLDAARGRDFEAFNLYMKGRHAWELRTEDALNRSVQYFEAAIRRDPQYALAHAGLADAYTTLGTYGFLPNGEAYARAAAAAAKAVSLDGSLPEAHLSLAYAQKNRFEWKAADASFKRVIDLKPGMAQGHHWYSIYLTQMGRFPEAIVEIKTALSLDPLSIGAHLQMASLLLMARRYEDAISQWQRAVQMDPAFVNAYRGITSAYTHLALYDKALAAAGEAARKSPLGAEDQELKADLGYVLAVSGRKTEARTIARALEDRFQHAGEEVAGSIAAIFAGLRDVESAFEWLARACKRRDPEMGYLKVDPKWDPLRGDPRFEALLTSLGFVE